MINSLEYYVNLPYKVEITPAEDGGFNAVIPDLKGCVAFGETVEEAYQTITEVKLNWIEIALKQGWQIPEPASEEIKEYSGRYVVRLPRYLHRELAEMAETEGTSLNQLSVAFLSEGAERWRQERLSVQHERERKELRPYVSYGLQVGRTIWGFDEKERKELRLYVSAGPSDVFHAFDAGEYEPFKTAASSKVRREQEYTM